MSSFSIFLALIIFVSFLLVLVIMVQNPKGGGLSSSFGGDSQQIGGVKKTTDFLDKSTWVLASLLLILILLSNLTIEKGTENKLIGFTLKERGIPRNGYKIFDSEQNEIGQVTSGTMSPILKKGIGMGYVKTSKGKLGTEILIQIRNKYVKSEIIKPPFI